MKPSDFTSKRTGRFEKIDKDVYAFVPNPLPRRLDFSREIRDASESALLALGKLDAIIPALPNPQLLTAPFMRREAVLSSKIEGTNTELEQLYLFETEERIGARQRADSGDAGEVLNYVRALQYGLNALDKMPICNRLLRETHDVLLEGVREDRGRYKFPGQFRKVQAYIGSKDIRAARYVAPQETHVERLMAELETYINDHNTELPTLAKVALIHYQFEAIHPFCDGNGRVGRVLILLLLSSYQVLGEPLLYLSAYFERRKDEYVARLLDVSTRGTWKEWIVFFLSGVVEESQDAIQRAKRLGELREAYRRRIQQSRASAASALQLVDTLFHWPVTSVSIAREKLGMTFKGAQANVQKLVEHDILAEVTGAQRNRLYIAKEIIKVIS